MSVKSTRTITRDVAEGRYLEYLTLAISLIPLMSDGDLADRLAEAHDIEMGGEGFENYRIARSTNNRRHPAEGG